MGVATEDGSIFITGVKGWYLYFGLKIDISENILKLLFNFYYLDFFFFFMSTSSAVFLFLSSNPLHDFFPLGGILLSRS